MEELFKPLHLSVVIIDSISMIFSKNLISLFGYLPFFI